MSTKLEPQELIKKLEVLSQAAEVLHSEPTPGNATSVLAKQAAEYVKKAERDSLMLKADNDAMQKALAEAITLLPAGADRDRLLDVCNNFPACELSRRDNQLRADLLEAAASDIMQMDDRANKRGISTAVLMMSRDYRKLAEEDS